MFPSNSGLETDENVVMLRFGRYTGMASIITTLNMTNPLDPHGDNVSESQIGS